MSAATDARNIAQAREALTHARSHLIRIATCLRHAETATVGEVISAIEAGKVAADALYDDLSFLDALMAEISR
jgi:hypothetical protein